MPNPIKMADPIFDHHDVQAASECVASGWISSGPRVSRFEDEIAAFLDVSNVVAMNNGTSTLHALLWCLGVRAGDEVIIPDITYMSSATAVLLIGAVPVLAPIDPRTWNIDSNFLEDLITPKTKLIMAVDLKGMPSDYESLSVIARLHRIPVVSDSAEAFGAKYKNDFVGKQCVAHSFSMFANKPLTAGEGGFITTDDPSLAQRLREFRNVGQSARYFHATFGSNYRMTDLIASIGSSRLQKFNTISERRKMIQKQFFNGLAKEVALGWMNFQDIPGYVSQHGLYALGVEFKTTELRDQVQHRLERNAVETRISFPPIHSQPCLREFDYRIDARTKCVSDDYFSKNLDLPNHEGLSNDDVIRVIGLIREALRGYCSDNPS